MKLYWDRSVAIFMYANPTKRANWINLSIFLYINIRYTISGDNFNQFERKNTKKNHSNRDSLKTTKYCIWCHTNIRFTICLMCVEQRCFSIVGKHAKWLEFRKKQIYFPAKTQQQQQQLNHTTIFCSIIKPLAMCLYLIFRRT